MVYSRIHEKTKRRYKKSMRDVIKSLARTVDVYRPALKVPCDNCYFDRMTSKSTNKCKWTEEEAISKQAEWGASHQGELRYKFFIKGRCPICKALGYTEIKRKSTPKCLITWNPIDNKGNNLSYSVVGVESATLVQLKTDPKHFDLFQDCERMVVDGVDCLPARPPILRGIGNQTILVAVGYTNIKNNPDSGEIVKDYR